MTDLAPSALLIGANGGLGTAVARQMLSRRYRVTATVSGPEKIAPFESDFPGCHA
jgi:uncharacterized protein YbjT (DUF2867 family)